MRPGLEGSNVLGQAASAEPDAGAQETTADTIVHADRLGESCHIGPRRVADLGHGVDEGDLRGQERVRTDLDQFGRRIVHDEARGAGGQDLLIDRVHHLLCTCRSAGIGRQAVDHAVRPQGVLHGEAFPQELWIPHQQSLRWLDRLGQAGSCANGHRGLACDNLKTIGAVSQVREHGGDRRIDIGHIRGPRLGLRSTHPNEMDLGAFNGGEVLGEG